MAKGRIKGAPGAVVSGTVSAVARNTDVAGAVVLLGGAAALYYGDASTFNLMAGSIEQFLRAHAHEVAGAAVVVAGGALIGRAAGEALRAAKGTMAHCFFSQKDDNSKGTYLPTQRGQKTVDFADETTNLTYGTAAAEQPGPDGQGSSSVLGLGGSE